MNPGQVDGTTLAEEVQQAGIKPARAAIVGGIGLLSWLLTSAPVGLTDQAWQLFIVFITTIALVITGAMPIFVAAIAALAVSVLSRTLTPQQAFSGFSNGILLLIASAFLFARAFIKSGLGTRIAYWVISKLGRTTLGLGYSMVATDLLIAPAFPSNTARSGVLFPITQSLALGSGSSPDAATRKKTGAFLMMMSMAGLSISSSLWMTAMAANPVGAEMAQEVGVEISFGSWFLAASLPALLAFALVPYLLFRTFTPEIVHTPEAPAKAREHLRNMGPCSTQEWIMGSAFLGLVGLWSVSKELEIDAAALAFAGLFVVMISGIFTVRDLKKEGGTLEVFFWFGILYTLSTQLGELGFMSYLGEQVSGLVEGYSWTVVYVVLLTSYVFLHYFFVSQTAHMLALFPVYLQVGVNAGVDPALLAYLLLFATNFFACITPQGSSANVIFAASGYLTTGEIYKYGGMVTLANLLVFGIVGPLWIMAML